MMDGMKMPPGSARPPLAIMKIRYEGHRMSSERSVK